MKYRFISFVSYLLVDTSSNLLRLSMMIWFLGDRSIRIYTVAWQCLLSTTL